MREAVRSSTPPAMVAMWRERLRRDTFEDGESILVYKTYEEVKHHSSKGIQDKVIEAERDNYENYEYV